MAVATVAVTGSDRLASEQETEERQADFREQQARLQEAQRRERMIQEEAEMDSITGDVRVRNESVKFSSYAGLFLVAVFKDALDCTIVLAFPGLATVTALCSSILIALLLFFPKRRYKIVANPSLLVRDFSILLSVFLVEGFVFPLNILPCMILAPLGIYLSDKKFVAARNAKRFDRKKMKAELTNIIRKASSAKGRLEA